VGPRTWPLHRDIGDAGWKQVSPLIERKQTCVESRRRFTEHVSDVNFTVTGSVFMPVTKVPCRPRETAISRDRWRVVVTVVVWCPLQILYVPRCAWNRRVSVRQDSGDAGAQYASPILSNCNGLCFGARYESSLWAQRNSHFMWPVASCGNGHCLMPVTNISYQ
jgi:hypothetical protein